jgi:hypothetical protein
MKTIRNTKLFCELQKVYAEGGNLLAALFDDHDGMVKDERIPCFANTVNHIKVTDKAIIFYDYRYNDVTRKFRICKELEKVVSPRDLFT